MDAFDKAEFNRFIIDNRVVGFFDRAVTLKSGRKSHWYVNWRTVAGDVFLIDRLSNFLIDFVSELGLSPTAFYGVPEGATKLGIITTYKWAIVQDDFGPSSHCLPMGRGRAKEHGVPVDRFFVGEPKGRIAVVEDVTTTGSSLLAELDRLKEVDVEVIAAIGITNRMELTDDGMSVEDAVNAKGVPYYALSQATSFLPEAYRILKPGENIGREIEKEFEEYGVAALRLVD